MKNFTFLDYEAYNVFENELDNHLEQCRIKKIRKQPSQHTIDAILNFSKSLRVKNSKYIGYIEEILN